MNKQSTVATPKKEPFGVKLFWSAFHAVAISIVASALPLLADAGVKHGADRWITFVVGASWLLIATWKLVVSPWVP